MAARTSIDLRGPKKRLGVIISAGGHGARLFPFTDGLPKPLVALTASVSALDQAVSDVTPLHPSVVAVTAQYEAEILAKEVERRYPEAVLLFTRGSKRDGDALSGHIEAIDSWGVDSLLILPGDHVRHGSLATAWRSHKQLNRDLTLISIPGDSSHNQLVVRDGLVVAYLDRGSAVAVENVSYGGECFVKWKVLRSILVENRIQNKPMTVGTGIVRRIVNDGRSFVGVSSIESIVDVGTVTGMLAVNSQTGFALALHASTRDYSNREVEMIATRELDRPVLVLSKFPRGGNNASYLVDVDGSQRVLKVSGPNERLILGVKTQHHAFRADIAPRIWWMRPFGSIDNGLGGNAMLLEDQALGVNAEALWPTLDYHRKARILGRLGQVVRVLHDLPLAEKEGGESFRRASAYEIPRDEVLKSVERRVAELISVVGHAEMVHVHGDIQLANFILEIDKEHLPAKLIDFERAGIGTRYDDLIKLILSDFTLDSDSGRPSSLVDKLAKPNDGCSAFFDGYGADALAANMHWREHIVISLGRKIVASAIENQVEGNLIRSDRYKALAAEWLALPMDLEFVRILEPGKSISQRLRSDGREHPQVGLEN